MEKQKLNHRDVGKLWNENADAWTHLARLGCDVYRDLVNTPAFMKMLPEVKGLRGLDVGCGEGNNTRIVADKGAELFAFDIASKFVKFAKEESDRRDCGIAHFEASAVEMPFRDSAFDFVMATMSMMDMPEHDIGVKEVHRVLKPGGFFQFSICHPCFMTRRWKKVFDEDGKEIAVECGDYFNPLNGEIEEWTFSRAPADLREKYAPFRVPYFDRTLASWLNMLIGNGFILEEFVEPVADDEAIKVDNGVADTRTVAYFLIIRCRKPS
ncbi:MAG: class I SAM-dependent methyltransferase [Calditrichaeota bacterium]|nr:class I SAM-dependent methyltransferase [Calditrichota bacterium]